MRLMDLQVELERWLMHAGPNRIAQPEALATPLTAPGPLDLFEAPLVGVASAADPLWGRLRAPDVVGPHHLPPDAWVPGARSVVAFFLPFTARVREANRVPTETATEWLYGRYEGGFLVEAMAKALAAHLRASGWRALVPVTDPRYAVQAMRANWSERHAAYIAGLGTFSLSRSLITRAGSAGRIGSVVTDAPLPHTPRLYETLDAYCGRCGACIPRCPAAAITEAGKEHGPCKVWQDGTLARHQPRYGCGKCQTRTPCEHRIPVRR